MSLNFELLFESLPDSYLVLNAYLPKFPVVAASRFFLSSTKKNREQILNQSLQDIFPLCNCLQESLQEVLTKKMPLSVRVAKLFHTEDESWDVKHFPILEDDGKVSYIVQRLTDVRYRTEALAELDGEGIARSLTERLPIALSYVNSKEQYLYCNSTFAKWRGLSKDKIVGHSVKDFLDEENYILAKKVINETLAGAEQTSEVNIIRDGSTRTVQAINIPDREHSGKICGFTNIAIDVTAQKELELSLREAKQAAEEANRAKSEFLANMSHEIRTPLGAVLGFADLIANSNISVEEKKSFTSAIQRNGELLTNIISDILDISKVEVGKLNVDRKEALLNDILNDVMAILGKSAQEKQVALVLSFDHSVPAMITTDALRLHQILLNVVGNAIKFTEKGSVKLDIKLLRNGTSKPLLAFDVTDSGRGISEEQAKRLFKPFSQGDSTVLRKFGGTGLGLALSRHLANLLGGDFVLTQSSPGRGSVFTVSIDPSPFEYEDKLKEHTSATKNYTKTDVRLDGTRVLLVDDSMDNQYFISKVLEIAGAAVEVADNGKVALEKAKTGDYQICLMDIQMPVMDGYEAASEMKKMNCPFPIIALTAHALKDVRQQCIESGFTDYITKPINRNELIEHIADLIRK